MKKILFTIVVAIGLVSCSEYYYEESNAERAYYAIDSTVCVVEGVFTEVVSPFSRRQGWSAPPKRRALGPSVSRAIVTNYATYYYKWQGDERRGSYWYEEEDSIMANIMWGDTVRAYGMVRTITNWEGFTFQDIIIDSICVLNQ